MIQRIRIYTHEVIVHGQVNELEKLLNRSITYEVTLNTRTVRSNIEFEVDEKEIELIKGASVYTVMIKENDYWIPLVNPAANSSSDPIDQYQPS